MATGEQIAAADRALDGVLIEAGPRNVVEALAMLAGDEAGRLNRQGDELAADWRRASELLAGVVRRFPDLAPSDHRLSVARCAARIAPVVERYSLPVTVAAMADVALDAAAFRFEDEPAVADAWERSGKLFEWVEDKLNAIGI